jgi:hypothetical protein
LADGDRVVISRVSGLIPGTTVRTRNVDVEPTPDAGIATAARGDD